MNLVFSLYLYFAISIQLAVFCPQACPFLSIWKAFMYLPSLIVWFLEILINAPFFANEYLSHFGNHLSLTDNTNSVF